jgi:hypothetical protein
MPARNPKKKLRLEKGMFWGNFPGIQGIQKASD